jgi:predicted nucleotidyltransferase
MVVEREDLGVPEAGRRRARRVGEYADAACRVATPPRGTYDDSMITVTPADTARVIVARFARAQGERAARTAAIRAQVFQEVLPAAQALGAGRVFLFGSFAWGEPHAGSDVDLAVEGLSAAGCDALAAALLFRLDAPIDVVPLNGAAAGLRDRVLAEGLLLGDARLAWTRTHEPTRAFLPLELHRNDTVLETLLER